MSCSPNTLLVASIRPPNGQPDEFLEADVYGERLLDIDGELYDAYTSENTEMGIYPAEESFAIYENLTYGWGDTVELSALMVKIQKFKDVVSNYCDKNNCTYRIDLTANYW